MMNSDIQISSMFKKIRYCSSSSVMEQINKIDKYHICLGNFPTNHQENETKQFISAVENGISIRTFFVPNWILFKPNEAQFWTGNMNPIFFRYKCGMGHRDQINCVIWNNVSYQKLFKQYSLLFQEIQFQFSLNFSYLF